jgi:polyisoprenoid-binding protein YceI
MRIFLFILLFVFIVASGVWWYTSGTAIELLRVSDDAAMATSIDTDIVQSASGGEVVGDVPVSAPEEDMVSEGRTVPGAGTYTINTQESVLGWAGKKPLIDGYVNSGTIAVAKGDITIAPDRSVSGGFVLDMNSITVGLTAAKPGAENALQDHLKGDAFFRVAEYPTAEFVVTQSELLGDFSYRITGNLTLLGKTEEVTFDAEAFATDGGNVLTVLAQFAIDRTRWGITVGSGSFFENLGDRLIADEVLLDVLVVTTRSAV